MGFMAGDAGEADLRRGGSSAVSAGCTQLSRTSADTEVSCRSALWADSAFHTSPTTASEFQYLGFRRHRGIAGGGHRKGAMCRAVINGRLQGFPAEKTIDKSG